MSSENEKRTKIAKLLEQASHSHGQEKAGKWNSESENEQRAHFAGKDDVEISDRLDTIINSLEKKLRHG